MAISQNKKILPEFKNINTNDMIITNNKIEISTNKLLKYVLKKMKY